MRMMQDCVTMKAQDMCPDYVKYDFNSLDMSFWQVFTRIGGNMGILKRQDGGFSENLPFMMLRYTTYMPWKWTGKEI